MFKQTCPPFIYFHIYIFIHSCTYMQSNQSNSSIYFCSGHPSHQSEDLWCAAPGSSCSQPWKHCVCRPHGRSSVSTLHRGQSVWMKNKNLLWCWKHFVCFLSGLFGTTLPPGSSVSGSRHENCHQRIQRAVSDSKHGDGRHQSEASGPADGALSEGGPRVRVEKHFTVAWWFRTRQLLSLWYTKQRVVFRLEEGQPALELRIRVEEEVLTEATKTPGPGSSLISTLPELEAAIVEPLCVPGCGEESQASLQAADDQKDCRAADLESAQQNMRFVLTTCDPYSPWLLKDSGNKKSHQECFIEHLLLLGWIRHSLVLKGHFSPNGKKCFNSLIVLV